MTWKPDYLTPAAYASWARVGDTVDDTEVALHITAASRAIDDALHRQFGQYASAAARVYRSKPWYDDDLGLYLLEIDDVQDTTGMTVGGVALASSGATLLPDNALGDGEPYTLIGFATCPTRPLSIVAKWGWTAVPNQVVAACKLQTSRFMARRDSPYGVAGSPSDGSELRLQSRLDPDVFVALGKLGRERWPR